VPSAIVACATAQTRRRGQAASQRAAIATDPAAAGPKSGQRGEHDAGERQQQAAARLSAQMPRRQGTDEVATVVGRGPLGPGGRRDAAVAQHQRQQGREGEAADAHRHRQRDDADGDDGELADARRPGRVGQGAGGVTHRAVA
jgi:hypothetical protein